AVRGSHPVAWSGMPGRSPGREFDDPDRRRAMTDGPLRPAPGPPRPLAAPAAAGAGDGALEVVLARLDGLDGLATADHVGVLQAVHDALVAELARTEDWAWASARAPASTASRSGVASRGLDGTRRSSWRSIW